MKTVYALTTDAAALLLSRVAQALWPFISMDFPNGPSHEGKAWTAKQESLFTS